MLLRLSRVSTRTELRLAASPPRLAPWPKARLGHLPIATRLSISTAAAQRGYATSGAVATGDKPADGARIAVLGGGLTGLTTAFFLSLFAPRARITLYDASDRLGGWVHTVRSETRNSEGETHCVRFERGPRVVQLKEADPNSHLYVLLLHQLGIADQAWALGQDSELARRYIYHPDHLIDLTGPVNSASSLTRAASWTAFAARMLKNSLTEPALKGLLPALAQMLSSRKPMGCEEYCRRLVESEDESIGACLTRLFGGRRHVADNLASAMTHGIYGGNIWNLSIQSTLFAKAQMFPHRMVEVPGLDDKSGFSVDRLSDLNMMKLVSQASSKDCTVIGESLFGGYTGFYGGMETLTDTLVQALRKRHNVTIKTGTPVYEISPSSNTLIEVKTQKSTEQFDKVISTIFSQKLAAITSGLLPALKDKKAASMHVVNIWFPKSGLNHPHHGFGYLISSQADVEPGLLGVLFDSDREEAVWREQQRQQAASGATGSGSSPQPPPPTGTKLTVLLRVPTEHEPPRSPEQAEAVAMAHVRRQFGIAADEPVHTQVSTARDCIPQHEVGHQDRMAAAHAQLHSAFRGRLAVAGPSYTSPGILPSIRAGFDVAADYTSLEDAYHGLDPPKDRPFGSLSSIVPAPAVGATGLGRFAEGRRTLWDDLVIVDAAAKRDYVSLDKGSSRGVIIPRVEFGSLPKL